MRTPWPYILAATLVSLCIVLVAFGAGGGETEGLRLAARYTARWSFTLFLIAYLAPHYWLHLGAAGTRAAILAFALAHAVHLAALVSFRLSLGEAPTLDSLLFGGAAYGLIALLAMQELRGRATLRLREGVLHYALFIIVLTYLFRLASPEQFWTGVVGASIGAAAFAARLAVALRSREG